METCLQPKAQLERGSSARGSNERPGRLPGEVAPNLLEWIDLRLLSAWIEEEVDRFAPSVSENLPEAQDGRESFRAMLRLLSLAYTTGLSDSTEIVDAC